MLLKQLVILTEFLILIYRYIGKMDISGDEVFQNMIKESLNREILLLKDEVNPTFKNLSFDLIRFIVIYAMINAFIFSIFGDYRSIIPKMFDIPMVLCVVLHNYYHYMIHEKIREIENRINNPENTSGFSTYCGSKKST